MGVGPRTSLGITGGHFIVPVRCDPFCKTHDSCHVSLVDCVCDYNDCCSCDYFNGYKSSTSASWSSRNNSRSPRTVATSSITTATSSSSSTTTDNALRLLQLLRLRLVPTILVRLLYNANYSIIRLAAVETDIDLCNIHHSQCCTVCCIRVWAARI